MSSLLRGYEGLKPPRSELPRRELLEPAGGKGVAVDIFSMATLADPDPTT